MSGNNVAGPVKNCGYWVIYLGTISESNHQSSMGLFVSLGGASCPFLDYFSLGRSPDPLLPGRQVGPVSDAFSRSPAVVDHPGAFVRVVGLHRQTHRSRFAPELLAWRSIVTGGGRFDRLRGDIEQESSEIGPSESEGNEERHRKAKAVEGITRRKGSAQLRHPARNRAPESRGAC